MYYAIISFGRYLWTVQQKLDMNAELVLDKFFECGRASASQLIVATCCSLAVRDGGRLLLLPCTLGPRYAAALSLLSGTKVGCFLDLGIEIGWFQAIRDQGRLVPGHHGTKVGWFQTIRDQGKLVPRPRGPR